MLVFIIGYNTRATPAIRGGSVNDYGNWNHPLFFSLNAATYCCCIVTENTNDASAAVVNKLLFIDFVNYK
jgi:hypothetical protein